MKSLRVCSLVVLLLARPIAESAETGEAFASETDKAALIERISKAGSAWEAVRAWLIEYEAVPTNRGELSPLHLVMAVSAPGEFYHMGAHFMDKWRWEQDPFCQELFIHAGTVCHRWPFNRSYSQGTMRVGEAIRGSIPNDVLLSVIPRWPLTDHRFALGKGGKHFLAIEALASSDYRLLIGETAILGEECHVFDQSNVDRLWIASSKGWCVMRRDIRDPASGSLERRTLTDKLEQIGPGLWFPVDFRCQFFDIGKAGSEGPIKAEVKVHILDFRLNDSVPQSTFIPVHRPGSLLVSESKHYAQVSPGGEDLLAQVVSYLRSCSSPPRGGLYPTRFLRWFVGGFGGGILLAVMLNSKPRVEHKLERSRGAMPKLISDKPR